MRLLCAKVSPLPSPLTASKEMGKLNFYVRLPAAVPKDLLDNPSDRVTYQQDKTGEACAHITDNGESGKSNFTAGQEAKKDWGRLFSTLKKSH